MEGIIVIDKPEGFTSFDVIAVMRRALSQRKIGHTGTLDPNATGVLPLLLGGSAKAQDIIPDSDKSYTAGFMLGRTTDTLDIWGKTVSEKPLENIKRADIEAVIPDFTGDIFQLPPMYSAVRIDGKRLYDLARRGIEVERKARPVTVRRLALTDFDAEKGEGTLDIACSKGTYVRSLIDGIGARLGCGAVMTSLRRTRACGFTLGDCVTLEKARALAEKNELQHLIKPVESLFYSFPCAEVSDAQAKRFLNGGALDLKRLRISEHKDGGLFRVRDRRGAFCGIGRVDAEAQSLKIYKLFSRPSQP